METGIAVYISIMSLALLNAFVTNISIIIIVFRSKAMHTTTNILICNLAISDLMFTAFILPQNLHDMSHAREEWFEGGYFMLYFT